MVVTRRRSAYDRGVSARFISRKVLGSLATLAFVVVFNFFLFRVVETDPVGEPLPGQGADPDASARS